METREWTSSEYTVRVRPEQRELALVEYQDHACRLTLDAEFGADNRLLIRVPNKVKAHPGSQKELSEEQIVHIQQRISQALTNLQFLHNFMRLGWTSIT